MKITHDCLVECTSIVIEINYVYIYYISTPKETKNIYCKLIITRGANKLQRFVNVTSNIFFKHDIKELYSFKVTRVPT